MNLNEFEKRINYFFKNSNLMREAFTHRSFVNENKDIENHNERLEFLGDAVLELSATGFLFHKFPKYTEGELTAIRSALVNTHSLSLAAGNLDMGNYLHLSKGEQKTEKGRKHIMANTFEAVIGALYLDGGFDVADNFLKNELFDYVDEILEKSLHKDPKSLFQEKSQEIEKITPQYKLIKDNGPDHDKKFIMGAFIGEVMVGKGEGTSKHKAEVSAARDALKKKKWL